MTNMHEHAEDIQKPAEPVTDADTARKVLNDMDTMIYAARMNDMPDMDQLQKLRDRLRDALDKEPEPVKQDAALKTEQEENGQGRQYTLTQDDVVLFALSRLDVLIRQTGDEELKDLAHAVREMYDGLFRDSGQEQESHLPEIDNRERVEVHWHDAHGVTRDWKTIEDVDDEAANAVSVGVLLSESETALVVVPHFVSPPAGVEYCGQITIPRSCVVRILRLARPR